MQRHFVRRRFSIFSKFDYSVSLFEVKILDRIVMFLKILQLGHSRIKREVIWRHSFTNKSLALSHSFKNMFQIYQQSHYLSCVKRGIEQVS